MNEIITEQSQLTVAQIKEAVNRMKKQKSVHYTG